MALDLSIIIKADSADAQTELKRLSGQVDTFGKVSVSSSQAAAAGFRDTSSGVKSVSQQLATAKSQLLAFVGLYQAVAAVRWAVDVAEDYKSISARLTNATDGQEDFNRAQEQTVAIAMSTGQSLDGIAGLYGKLRLNAGMAADDAERLTEILAQATQLDGGGASAQAALFQLQQGLASGTLRGEELNSVLEQTPTLALAIARGLDMPIGALRQFAAEGKLTAESVKEALFEQEDAIKAQFENLPLTVGKALTNIRTAAIQEFGAIDARMGATAATAHTLNSVAENFGDILGGVTLAAELLSIVLAGRLTKALTDKTKAVIDTTASMVAQRAASAAAAQQAVAGAQAELARTSALLAEAQAEKAAATATSLRGVALTNINVRLAQATAAQTAATSALSVAQATAARQVGLLSVAGRGLLGVLGGVPGLIVGGVTAIGLWAASSNTARGATSDWRDSIDQLTGSMDTLRSKQLTTEIDSMTARIAEQEQVVLRLHQRLRTDPYASVKGTRINAQATADLMQQQQELDDMRNAVERLRVALADLHDVPPPKIGDAVAPDTSAVEAYIAALREQIDMVGASEVTLAQHRVTKDLEEKAAKAAADGNDDLAAAFRAAIPQAQQLAAQIKHKEAATRQSADADKEASSRAVELASAWDADWAAILRTESVYESMLSSMRDEIRLLGLTARERFAETKIREVQAQAQRANINLSRDEIAALREQALALYDATDAVRANSAEADPYAEAWKRALQRIDDSFAAVWRGAFDSFNDFSRSLLGSFKGLLAEMAHAAITRPIVLSLGASMGILPTVASAGGGLLGSVTGGGGGMMGSLGALGGSLGAGMSVAMGNYSAAGLFGGMGANFAAAGNLLGAGQIGAGMMTGLAALAPIAGAVVLLASLRGSRKVTGAGLELGYAGGGDPRIAELQAQLAAAQQAPGGDSLGAIGANQVAGLQSELDSLMAAQQGGGLLAREYTRYKRSSLLGSSTSYNYDTIDPAAADAIDSMLQTVFDQINTQAQALGMEAATAVEDFYVEASRLNLKGKTEEEIQAAIEEWVQSVADAYIEHTTDSIGAVYAALIGAQAGGAATTQMFTALAGLAQMAGQSPVAAARTDFATQTTATDTYRQQVDALRELMDTYDGSLDATLELAAAYQQTQVQAYELSLALLAAGASVDQMLGGLAEQIRQDMMGEQELYEYRQQQVHELAALMETLTDPAQIQNAAQQIEQISAQMWQSLTDTQQAAMGPEFISAIDAYNATAQQQIEAALQGLDAEAADISLTLDAALERAAAAIVAGAEQSQAAAADIAAAASQLNTAAGSVASAAAGMPTTITVQQTFAASPEVG